MSVGVKVAVITQLPAPTIVAVEPLIVSTELLPEVKLKLPVVFEVGAVIVKLESVVFLVVPLQVRVGFPLEMSAESNSGEINPE